MLIPLTDPRQYPDFYQACCHEHVFGSKILTALHAYGMRDPRVAFWLQMQDGKPTAALYKSGSVLVISASPESDPAPIAELIRNQGIHEVNRLISVLGVPKKVRAMIRKQRFDIEAEDLGICEWLYEDGCVARLSATTSYTAPTWYTKFDIYGDKGAYVQCMGGPEGEHTYWLVDGKWTEETPYPYEREWRQGSDNFAYCLRTGAKPVVTAEDGRTARYVLEKMYESAQSDENWVEI